MKLYVVEQTIKNADGDILKRIETYRSKPNKVSYVIWI